MGFDSANRIISGTFGSLWLNSKLVAECYGFQAKVTQDKKQIARCGTTMSDHKVMGRSGKGSIKLHKVGSRMQQALSNEMRKGKDPRFEIISKLADPDAYGAERVKIKSVSFDELTLANWEANAEGKEECPFTFTDWEYLDKIEVQE